MPSLIIIMALRSIKPLHFINMNFFISFLGIDNNIVNMILVYDPLSRLGQAARAFVMCVAV